ncbi:MAG: OmpA family protein [Acidobacteriota bacterium]|nr:OmpA family protein [Acidobacteriota bacterium]
MRRSLFAVSVSALVLVVSTACATKGYVNKQIADVNTKVEGVSKAVEATQAQTKQNADKIQQVDQSAQAGISDAKQAAGNAASAAQKAQSTASQADSTATALDQQAKRLVAEVVLSEAEGNFKLGSAKLPESATAKIDDMMSQLKANPKAVYFEIDGYTDSTGSAAYNKRLGMARADAVRDYLYTKYQVALHRMNVYSYGESDPVASNKTRAGRAQNRRVVIKVVQ